MQKTEHFGCPWRKTNAPLILGLVATLFVSLSLSARAQALNVQLAMSRPNPATTSVTPFKPASTEPVHSAPILKPVRLTSKAVQTKTETNPVPAVTINVPLGQSGNPEQNAPLVLARENLSDNRSLVVGAGYGRLWDSQCAFKYISPARQEPGCAYVKASINF